MRGPISPHSFAVKIKTNSSVLGGAKSKCDSDRHCYMTDICQLAYIILLTRIFFIKLIYSLFLGGTIVFEQN